MAVGFSPSQSKMEPPSFLPSSFISLFITLSIFKTLILSSADNYTICSSPLKCGNSTFTYPFWGEGRPNFCGYPGFELQCDGEQPEIKIMARKYVIGKIDPSRHSITVSPTGYWNTSCPYDLENTILNLTIFDYASEVVHLILYSSCSSPDLAEFLPEFNCSGEGRSTTGFVATRSLQTKIENLDNLIRCAYKVLVPVNQVEEEELENNPLLFSRVISAIRAGFTLIWMAENDICDNCLRSGGLCGSISGRFNCYCRDGENYSTVCISGKSSSNRKAVVAGIALGAAIFTGIVLIGFVFIRFRIGRRREVISSDSSSFVDYRFDSSKKSNYFGLQMFSYPELEEATNNFDPSRELGEGGFGVVYHGELRDERAVAVKRLYERNLRSVEQFMNEVQILARLRHPNLVTLYGCTSRRCRELLLVYEYVSNGTVADHLHGCRSSSGFLQWNLRLNIALETANALAYLHGSDVIHRDVKTNNILLDNGFHVKVADFGLSRLFPIAATHVSTAPQGTPGYVDPEYYNCYRLTDKSDVYSFGVVLMELVSSKEAVDITRHRHEINLSNLAMAKIQNRLLHELVDPKLGFQNDDGATKEITLVSELAFRCLQQERDVRPSMDEVVDILSGIAGSGSTRTRGTENAKVEDDSQAFFQKK